LAPVPSDRFEPYHLELLSRRPEDQTCVALLAAGRAPTHLREEEADVDLLELELEMAGAPEVAGDGLRHRARDRRAELLRPCGCPSGIVLAQVDEERIGVAVDPPVAARRDRRGRDPDDVLPRGSDRIRDRGREEARGGR